MNDDDTNLIINLISLGLIILDIILFLTMGKNLLKSKFANTFFFFLNLFLVTASIIGFFTNSLVSIGCSGAAVLLISILIIRKKMLGRKIKGSGLRSYKSLSS